jgi:hypothetical protein
VRMWIIGVILVSCAVAWIIRWFLIAFARGIAQAVFERLLAADPFTGRTFGDSISEVVLAWMRFKDPLRANQSLLDELAEAVAVKLGREKTH